MFIIIIISVAQILWPELCKYNYYCNTATDPELSHWRVPNKMFDKPEFICQKRRQNAFKIYRKYELRWRGQMLLTPHPGLTSQFIRGLE